MGRGEDVTFCYDGTSTEGGIISYFCCYEANLQKIHDSSGIYEYVICSQHTCQGYWFTPVSWPPTILFRVLARPQSQSLLLLGVVVEDAVDKTIGGGVVVESENDVK